MPDKGTQPLNATFPDPLTGLPKTGRNVMPTVGSGASGPITYSFTSDGRTQGMATVQQLVYLAIKTSRGSAALSPSATAPLGLDLSGAQVQGPDFERRLSAAFSSALAPLVKQGLITIVGFRWLPVGNPDGAAPWLLWKDNTTGGQFITNRSGQTFNASTVLGP